MNLRVRIIFFMIIKRWHFWKSVISGGITTFVDLSLLFILWDVLHLPHWLSINIPFGVAIVVNFSLQKFWTFSNQGSDVTHKQFIKFFIVAMGNMAMNSLIMYVLSVKFGFWYLGVQVFTIGILAVSNFVLYRYFVFKIDKHFLK